MERHDGLALGFSYGRGQLQGADAQECRQRIHGARDLLAWQAGFQCVFFGTLRGLGLATATTSAAFVPHFEQRSRGASALNVVDQPTKRARAWGSM